MVELSNSKKTYLGKSLDGQDKWSLDCSIGAIQYKDNLGVWQDITPKLVQSGDKYVSQGVPYHMVFDGLGGRREYPDKYDLSKYIDLPAIPLFRNLPKTFYQDRVVFTAPKFDLIMGLGNTGTFLEILFRQAPSFDRLTLDVDSAGFDILKLLLSKEGLGIPRPRLIDSSPEPRKERVLDWSFKNGQLEVGFDFTGLTFPVRFRNSPLDIAVAASGDDDRVYVASGVGTWSNTNPAMGAGKYSATVLQMGASARFIVAIAQGATITDAYLRQRAYNITQTGTVIRTKLCCEAADTATANTSYADYIGRTRTSTVDWEGIAAWSFGTFYNSPSLITPVQAVISRAGWISGKYLKVFWEDLGGLSDTAAFRYGESYDAADTGHTPPHLLVTFTTGWTNIKNIRAGTGVIAATDLSSIWFGTGEVAVADIAEIPVGVVV